MINKLLPGILLFVCFHINVRGQEQSYFKLTTSNGLIVAAYDVKSGRVDDAYPHLFANYDSGNYVYPFVGNIVLNNGGQPAHAGYLQNTHIIKAAYPAYDIYYYASFTRGDKILYITIRGEKDAIENLSFTAETGKGKPVSNIALLENHLQDLPIHINANTIEGSFMRRYSAAVWEKYFLYSFTDSLHTDAAIVKKAIAQLRRSKASLVDDELHYMKNVFARCTFPKELSAKETNVAEQSVSILKMSQVSDKEIFPLSHGQVLASVRPGLWHIAWVRDGSFAIQAMTRLGMYTEAKKALEFMLKAKSNLFKHYWYNGKDYGPGVDYQVSLTRYFGNGTEECDYNEYGPNIEYDDFGLFLIAFSDYASRSKDSAFYKKWNKLMCSRVADATVSCIDTNSLIKEDSGPWEHHLQMPRQYAFTSGVCARGLQLFAALQKQYGLPFKKYQLAAEKIKHGMLAHLLCDNKYFKGNVTDTSKAAHEYYDAGVYEIFANGLMDNKQLFLSHNEECDKVLRIKGERPGYIRLESSDPYENQEWVFINLRIAMAHLLFKNKAEAFRLLNFVTEQAAANNNLIPEMYSNKLQMDKVTKNFYDANVWCNCIRDKGDQYIGTIPMVGYGAGAYVLSLFGYYGK